MITKFKLCWWEDNGYHDSYFYGVYYDAEKDTLESVGLGATAFAGGIGFDDSYALPTPAVAERARQLLAERIFVKIKAAEEADINRPGPASVKRGRKFSLLEPHSIYARESSPCSKCNGTGNWIHPCNEKEIRNCFRCHGTGRDPKGAAFVKDADGKRIKITFERGTIFESAQEGVSFFGRTYARGYNQPNRFNSSVVALHEGHRIRIPLEKLRQAKPPLSDAILRQRAEELSHSHQYGALFGCKAWLSENWAQAVATTQRRNGQLA